MHLAWGMGHETFERDETMMGKLYGSREIINQIDKLLKREDHIAFKKAEQALAHERILFISWKYANNAGVPIEMKRKSWHMKANRTLRIMTLIKPENEKEEEEYHAEREEKLEPYKLFLEREKNWI